MILIIMGVSGSGKTTVGSSLSEKLGWTLHEGDDYHPKENIDKMASGVPLTDQEMSAGSHAILICSALKKLYRQLLLFGREALGGACQREAMEGVVFAFLSGSFQLIQARMVARKGHFMASNLLQSQFDTLEPPSLSENAVTVDISKSLPEIVAEIEAAISTRL